MERKRNGYRAEGLMEGLEEEEGGGKCSWDEIYERVITKKEKQEYLHCLFLLLRPK